MIKLIKSLALILTSVLMAVSGQILLKSGVEQVGRIGAEQISQPITLLIKLFTTPLILIGLFIYASSAILWIIVLSRLDLSFAYPFIGLTFVLITVASRFILTETVPPLRWVAVIVICLGIMLNGWA